MKDITKMLIEFREARDWKQFHSPENLSKSIVIEAAELLENFQWSKEFNKEKVVDELADILIYCVLMADSLEVEVDKIIKEKIVKNNERYPVEKAKGNSRQGGLSYPGEAAQKSY